MNDIEPPRQGEDAELLQVQRTLAAVYKVERLLARRGVTSVYVGEEIKAARPVALTIFPLSLGLGPATTQFRDVARLAMTLNHANLVPVYRVGFAAGAPYFVATRLVDGRTLEEILATQGALQVPLILAVLRGVAQALAFAHGKGVVHGSVAAANVLVDRDGHVLVTDTGIVRAVEDALPATAARAHPRTPEEVAGATASQAGDQYGLGMVVLELLTGTAQAYADPLASLRDVRATRVALPEALVQVAQTMLAADPTQRYASAADLLTAIQAITFSEADQREAAVTLGRLARGEPVPKLRPLAVPMPPGPSKTVATPAVKAPPAPKPQPTEVRPAAPAPKPAPAPAAQPTEVRPAVSVPKPPPPPPPAAQPTEVRPAVAAPPPPPPPPPPAPEPPPPPPLKQEPLVTASAFETASAPPAEAPPPPRRPSVPAAAAPEEAAAAPVFQRRSSRVTGARPVAGEETAAPAPAKRRSRLVPVLAVILVLAAAGGGAYWYFVLRPAAAPVAQAPVPVRPPAESVAAPPAVPAAVSAESLRADSLRQAAAADSARKRAADSARAKLAAAGGTVGQLTLNVDPSTATIYLDAIPVGSGGYLDSAVAPGRRHITITAAGFNSFDTIVVVPRGDALDLGDITLQTPAEEGASSGSTGLLRLTTEPSNARIFVEGTQVGVGSLIDWQMAPGDVHIRISAPGYATLDTTVTLTAGRTLRLGQITLTKNP